MAGDPDHIAQTEEAIAETLTRAASSGGPFAERRERKAAGSFRVAEHERVEAERLRAPHARERHGGE